MTKKQVRTFVAETYRKGQRQRLTTLQKAIQYEIEMEAKVIKEVCSIEPIEVPLREQDYLGWDDIRSESGDVFESDGGLYESVNASDAIRWAIDVKQEAGYSKEEVKKFVETELAIRKDEIRVTRVDASDPAIQDYIESIFKEEEKDEEPTSRYINLEIPDSDLKVQVKLDDEGVVVDVYRDDSDLGEMDVTASTYKFYNELGVKLITE
jgi:hypothetical protein